MMTTCCRFTRFPAPHATMQLLKRGVRVHRLTLNPWDVAAEPHRDEVLPAPIDPEPLGCGAGPWGWAAEP